ncbi:hypothetical protein A0H76_674 [Hepatospora eriocheir]|nr:hypothetical protein A0H76_674 [Hepatospora eriocheir]
MHLFTELPSCNVKLDEEKKLIFLNDEYLRWCDNVLEVTLSDGEFETTINKNILLYLTTERLMIFYELNGYMTVYGIPIGWMNDTRSFIVGNNLLINLNVRFKTRSQELIFYKLLLKEIKDFKSKNNYETDKNILQHVHYYNFKK